MPAPTAQRRWDNPLVPPQPTSQGSSLLLFLNPQARDTYWLPDPPPADMPALHDFWYAMAAGITEYVRPSVHPNGPKFLSRLPDGGSGEDRLLRFGGPSRESRSPNWSGASVRANGGHTLTQVVGSWVEPEPRRVGGHDQHDEFRSSVWVGFNGHASYLDASLPQIGTAQRIAFENGAWNTSHWAWFEWWANLRGKEDKDNVLPVYLQLDVLPGDTVWCRVDLIRSDPVHYTVERDFPALARMCMCVERPATGSQARTKRLVMPFVVYPPKPGNRYSQAVGSAANWITELPKNVPPAQRFLLPRLESGTPSGTNRVSFGHCAAGAAEEPGAPLQAEHTLAASRRFHLFSSRPPGRPSLARMAEACMPRPGDSDTAFEILVHGNDP